MGNSKDAMVYNSHLLRELRSCNSISSSLYNFYSKLGQNEYKHRVMIQEGSEKLNFLNLQVEVFRILPIFLLFPVP